jgi:hypothetical protein
MGFGGSQKWLWLECSWQSSVYLQISVYLQSSVFHLKPSQLTTSHLTPSQLPSQLTTSPHNSPVCSQPRSSPLAAHSLSPVCSQRRSSPLAAHNLSPCRSPRSSETPLLSQLGAEALTTTSQVDAEAISQLAAHNVYLIGHLWQHEDLRGFERICAVRGEQVSVRGEHVSLQCEFVGVHVSTEFGLSFKVRCLFRVRCITVSSQQSSQPRSSYRSSQPRTRTPNFT